MVIWGGVEGETEPHEPRPLCALALYGVRVLQDARPKRALVHAVLLEAATPLV